MWQVDGIPKEVELFGRFEAIEVLVWYDCPRTFTLNDLDGELCLAHWLDEDDNTMRFLVVPVLPKTIDRLKRGELSLREGVEQPRTYVVDQANDGGVRNVWLVKIANLPADTLPAPRVMLDSSLEPILSLRAIGETIRAGEIPGSVIKDTIDSAQRTLKYLAEYELGLPARQGRSSRALQKLYDLPVQNTLAASFEVQFRTPLSVPNLFSGLAESEIQEEEDILKRVGSHLKTGLEWLTSNEINAFALPLPKDQELNRVLIDALNCLIPSPRSAIKEIEIRGALATTSTEPIRLTDRYRKIINNAKSLLFDSDDSEQTVELRGRIRELNEKLMKFELHDVNGDSSQVRICKFDPGIWNDVHGLLGAVETVKIVGLETSTSSNVRVLSLERT